MAAFDENSTPKRRLRSGTLLAFGCICLLFVVGVAVLAIINIPIWEVRYYADLNSGRLGEERLLFGRQVAFDMSDTAVSLAAEPAGWISATPNWGQYSRVAYGSLVAEKSGHYWTYRQIKNAEAAWSKGEFTPEAKRESARRFLRSEPWGSYAIQIEELAKSHPAGGKRVEVSDLPPLQNP